MGAGLRERESRLALTLRRPSRSLLVSAVAAEHSAAIKRRLSLGLQQRVGPQSVLNSGQRWLRRTGPFGGTCTFRLPKKQEPLQQQCLCRPW